MGDKMKQHITVEQLNELSNEAKEKLQTWWLPQRGDRFYITSPDDLKNVDYMWGGISDDNIYIAHHIQKQKDGSLWVWDEVSETLEYGCGANINNTAPLLSIGQMIEFLVENNQLKTMEVHNNFITRVSIYKNGNYFNADEPCDALWEAVKGILVN